MQGQVLHPNCIPNCEQPPCVFLLDPKQDHLDYPLLLPFFVVTCDSPLVYEIERMGSGQSGLVPDFRKFSVYL